MMNQSDRLTQSPSHCVTLTNSAGDRPGSGDSVSVCTCSNYTIQIQYNTVEYNKFYFQMIIVKVHDT